MRIVALLATCPLTTPAWAAPPAPSVQPLSAAEVPAVLQPPARGVRVPALWALDCAYCEANLRLLGALRAAHPDVQVVTIATDPISKRDAIANRLRGAGVADLPARAYADAAPERINYLIDPHWGGETPRTLVLHADGSRHGISGELSKAQVQRLIH